jgi:hypothetical protein
MWEDEFAWQILAIGTFLLGTGASLPFVRWWMAIAIGLASPYLAFSLTVITVWSVIILNAILRFL